MLLCVLYLLLLSVAGHNAHSLVTLRQCKTRVAPAAHPCVDRVQLIRLTQRLPTDIDTSDDESILLSPPSFDNMAGKPLYNCVLHKILHFFEKVLEKQMENFADLRDYIKRMKTCESLVPCKEQCKTLYRKARQTPVNETNTEEGMAPGDVAVLQIQKLMQAMRQLDEVKVQEKAMFELKMLDFYLPDEDSVKQNQPQRRGRRC